MHIGVKSAAKVIDKSDRADKLLYACSPDRIPPIFVIVRECDVITISCPEYKVEIEEIIQDCKVIQTNKCSVTSVLKECSRTI